MDALDASRYAMWVAIFCLALWIGYVAGGGLDQFSKCKCPDGEMLVEVIDTNQLRCMEVPSD